MIAKDSSGNRMPLSSLIATGLALCLAAQANAAAEPPPKDRVIACYFHRTVRCPTCQKISAYAEEAIKSRFAKEIKASRVQIIMVDFQDAKNANLARHYEVDGPTLVIMKIEDNKVAAWKKTPKVWSLIGNKAQFLKYVQKEVLAYLEAK